MLQEILKSGNAQVEDADRADEPQDVHLIVSLVSISCISRNSQSQKFSVSKMLIFRDIHSGKFAFSEILILRNLFIQEVHFMIRLVSVSYISRNSAKQSFSTSMSRTHTAHKHAHKQTHTHTHTHTQNQRPSKDPHTKYRAPWCGGRMNLKRS